MESTGFVESSIRFCELTTPTDSLTVDAVNIGVKVLFERDDSIGVMLFHEYPVFTEAFS